MKKYSRDEYLNKKEYDFKFLAIVIALFLIPLLLPTKETMSCNNRFCSIKDYSILITYNRSYDLNKHSSNILYISNRRKDVDYYLADGVSKIGPSFYLHPISKCDYYSYDRASRDKYMLENYENVYLQHISKNQMILFIITYAIAFYCLYFNKKLFKYYMYFLLLLSLRLIYILII